MKIYFKIISLIIILSILYGVFSLPVLAMQNEIVEGETEQTNTQQNEEEQLENIEKNENSNEEPIESEEQNNINVQGLNIEEAEEKDIIEDGTYIIKSNINNQKVLNVDITSNNVQLWSDINNISQKFEFKYIESEDCYTIKSVLTGKYLDVYGGYKTAGTNVQIWQGNGTAGQKWEIKKDKEGYSIISKCNGLYLDVYGGYSSNGTNIQVWVPNATKGQQFIFEKVEAKQVKTIENGTYKIKLYSNKNKVLDVSTSTNNVLLWDNRNNDNQKFEFEYIEDEGCYTIKSNVTGKYLDVYGGYATVGTNVQMWQGNGTAGQKWIVQKNGDKYSIISKCNGLYLDVYGGYTSNGTNVQMWSYNGGTAQQFSIEEPEEAEQTDISEGIYKIHLASSYNKVIEVKNSSIRPEANVQVGESANSKNQYFYIKYDNNGDYQIQALNSGKMLDVYGGYAKAGTNVQQYTSNNTNGQKWKIQKEGNYYSIISKCGNLYLDIYGGYTAVGTNVQIWSDNGTIGQRFDLEEIKEDDIPVVSEGNYRIRTAVSKNMALDIYADSKANGANVQIYNSSNVLNQRFKLIYLENDTYKIQNLSSGKVLEVQGAGNRPETNVCQNEWKNIDSQKWKIVDAGDGFYYIISVSNGLYLDVYGGYSSNETNVQVYTGHGGVSQKFAIDSVIFGVDVSYYQGDINFNLMKSSGKVDFMIARAGYGRNDYQKDIRFEEYYAEAKRLGIPVGSYLYSYATDVSGAYAEAYNVLNWLSGKSFDLPIFYDLEDSIQDGVSPETMTQMAIAFCETLKSHGYKVGVYASKNWLLTRMNVDQLPEDYSIWVAAYGSRINGNNGFIPGEAYEYFGNHDIWQYSSQGLVEGISGYVDVNIAYKTHLK